MKKINLQMLEKALTAGSIVAIAVLLKEIVGEGSKEDDFISIDLNKLIDKNLE